MNLTVPVRLVECEQVRRAAKSICPLSKCTTKRRDDAMLTVRKVMLGPCERLL